MHIHILGSQLRGVRRDLKERWLQYHERLLWHLEDAARPELSGMRCGGRRGRGGHWLLLPSHRVCRRQVWTTRLFAREYVSESLMLCCTTVYRIALQGTVENNVRAGDLLLQW